jgi:hypothetical protein
MHLMFSWSTDSDINPHVVLEMLRSEFSVPWHWHANQPLTDPSPGEFDGQGCHEHGTYEQNEWIKVSISDQTWGKLHFFLNIDDYYRYLKLQQLGKLVLTCLNLFFCE